MQLRRRRVRNAQVLDRLGSVRPHDPKYGLGGKHFGKLAIFGLQRQTVTRSPQNRSYNPELPLTTARKESIRREGIALLFSPPLQILVTIRERAAASKCCDCGYISARRQITPLVATTGGASSGYRNNSTTAHRGTWHDGITLQHFASEAYLHIGAQDKS